MTVETREVKIGRVIVSWQYDDVGPLFLGSFTDEYKPGHIRNPYRKPGRRNDVYNFAYYRPETPITSAATYKYALQDCERLFNYYIDEWWCLGCVASAWILTPNNKAYLINEIHSSGLWGIESDFDDEYKKAIELEQIADLKQVFRQLGFNDDDIEQACKDYEVKE